MAKELTTMALEKLKPGPTRREIPDGRVGGLYFIVQPSGKRSWAYRYRLAGKPRKYTIGAYPAIALKTARERAGKAKDKVVEGPPDTDRAGTRPLHLVFRPLIGPGAKLAAVIDAGAAAFAEAFDLIFDTSVSIAWRLLSPEVEAAVPTHFEKFLKGLRDWLASRHLPQAWLYCHEYSPGSACIHT
jgi:hypothetical protein